MTEEQDFEKMYFDFLSISSAFDAKVKNTSTLDLNKN